MAEIEHTIVINRPVDEVFSFISRVENCPLWQSWAVEARVTSEGPMTVGTRYVYVAQFLGRRIESAGEVTAFEPNRRYAWKVTSGPIPMEADTTFDGSNGATKVTTTARGEPGGFFKLAEPVLVRVVRRQTETDCNNLKDLMEAGAGA